MKSFYYKGLKFKPIKYLKEKEADFAEISKKITDIGITPDNWDYDEFYKIAEENSATVDLYKVNGNIVIPSTNYLFQYNEQRSVSNV
ncbi:MAG: hypothetical protein ACOCRX_04590 [Candidatus Woesearchaeota archaeon]